jgi:hypothetical protein
MLNNKLINIGMDESQRFRLMTVVCTENNNKEY